MRSVRLLTIFDAIQFMRMRLGVVALDSYESMDSGASEVSTLASCTIKFLFIGDVIEIWHAIIYKSLTQ